MYLPRGITAVLEERLLFNFRIAPERLASILPVGKPSPVPTVAESSTAPGRPSLRCGSSAQKLFKAEVTPSRQ